MYGCGEQEVGVASGSGWNLWVWLLGVVVYVLFYSSIPTFCSFSYNHRVGIYRLYK